jgi:hypothetical protein
MAAGAVVTTVGKGLIAAVMVSGHVARFLKHGTGTATPVAGNTALGSVSTDVAVQGAESNSAATKYTVTGAIVSLGAQDITEVGLFKESGGTNLLYREVFAAISVIADDTITYTVDITAA